MKKSTTPLSAAENLDYAVTSMVLGQETYGFAVVAVGEALWSFLSAPSLSHAKVLIPATIAALVLVFVSGPMVTSSDPAEIRTGLVVATAVSVFLGLSYLARLFSTFSPSAKEIAFLGLLIAIAGFCSYTQNLLVDEFFVLPTIPLPQLPTIEVPSIITDVFKPPNDLPEDLLEY